MKGNRGRGVRTKLKKRKLEERKGEYFNFGVKLLCQRANLFSFNKLQFFVLVFVM